jgi:methionine-rich copper-binding protein CopC
MGESKVAIIQRERAAASLNQVAMLAASLTVAILTLLVAVGLPLATPAAAHSELISSSPDSGSTLDAPPNGVSLVFNEEIAQTGLQVVAQGPGGSVPLGEATVDGNTVAAPWPQGVGGGDFRVSYRVVSADGHPIDGTIAFSVAGAPAAANPAASEVAADPLDATASTGSGPGSSNGLPLWVPAIVVVVGVGIGATLARALRSRRSPGTDPTSGVDASNPPADLR